MLLYDLQKERNQPYFTSGVFLTISEISTGNAIGMLKCILEMKSSYIQTQTALNMFKYSIPQIQ